MAYQSDIVLENFKVGTIESMGLGYETLSQENPEIILASISGYGDKGPCSSWPGFDQIAQGYSGFMSLSGTEESGPMRVGTAIGDLTAGMWAAMATLAAYIQKQSNGKGQHVKTSLLASLVSLLSVQGQRYLSVGEIPQPTGNVHPVIAPYGTFETVDGPLNIAPATQDMWIRLCKILGLEELIDDPRFRINADRMQNRLELKQYIDKSLQQKTRMEWTAIMVEHGIPAGPINNLEDVFNDQQVLANDLVETVNHPIIGELKQVASPMLFSDHLENTVKMAPPTFGQHTKEVLLEFDIPEEKIEVLFKDKVVF